MFCVPGWFFLSRWKQLVERKWVMFIWQILNCGQWEECGMRCVSCGGVLLERLQLVERERAVCCGQLLDCRQRINSWFSVRLGV